MILIITTVAHYRKVSGEGGFMPIFDIFSDIKADIATAITYRNMKRAERNMHPDVSVKDYKMVFDIIQYQKETGCDWNSAIGKFTAGIETSTSQSNSL